MIFLGCKILQYLYILHRQCRSCTDPLVFPKRTYQVRLSRGYNLCLSVCLMIIISVTVRISNRLSYSCWDGKVSATLNLVVHTKSEHFTIVGQHNNTYELCQQLLDVMTCPDSSVTWPVEKSPWEESLPNTNNSPFLLTIQDVPELQAVVTTNCPSIRDNFLGLEGLGCLLGLD